MGRVLYDVKKGRLSTADKAKFLCSVKKMGRAKPLIIRYPWISGFILTWIASTFINMDPCKAFVTYENRVLYLVISILLGLIMKMVDDLWLS